MAEEMLEGRQYLSDLRRNFLEQATTTDVADPAVVARFIAELRGAAGALIAAGLLSKEAGDQFLVATREMLIDEHLLTYERTTLRAFDEGKATGLGSRRFFDQHPLVAIDTAPEPLRVLSQLRDLGPIFDGDRLVLLSLEIWSDRFILRFASYGAKSSRLPAADYRSLWSLSDDAGGTYGLVGMGWRTHAPLLGVLEMSFQPALRPDAHSLEMVANSRDGRQLCKATLAVTPTPDL